MIELIINNGEDDGAQEYVFDPMPGVVIKEVYRHLEDKVGIREREVTWTITGFFTPVVDTIVPQVEELKTYLEIGSLTVAKLVENDTIIEELPAEGGIRINSIDFPTGDGPEWATKRSFIVELKGSDFPAAVTTLGEYDYTITYATEQSGLITRTVTGSLNDVAGEAATAKYTTLKAAKGWATWSGANAITDSYTQNQNDTKCDFTIVHRKYWVGYGTANITNGSASSELFIDDQNNQWRRISGWFEGPELDCAAAIAAQYPAGSNWIKITESSTRQRLENRTNFNAEFLNGSAGSDILYAHQTLTIQEPVEDFVFKRVLGGGNPIRQVTSRTTGRAYQSGIIKRIPSNPVLPSPYWGNANVKSSRISYSTAAYKLGGIKKVFELNYAYDFEFAYNPSW